MNNEREIGMKLTPRKQLLKEAVKELRNIKESGNLSTSSIQSLIGALRGERSKYHKFKLRYEQVANMYGAPAKMLPIEVKGSVSIHYDFKKEKVELKVSDDFFDINFSDIERQAMKDAGIKEKMQQHSKMTKEFLKECTTWMEEVAVRIGVNSKFTKDDINTIMWRLFGR
jgi:hypothetical protein